MKVVSPSSFSHVTPLDRPVEKGEEVEVDDTLGEQLLAQGWKPATKKAKSPAPAVAPSEEQ